MTGDYTAPHLYKEHVVTNGQSINIFQVRHLVATALLHKSKL